MNRASVSLSSILGVVPGRHQRVEAGDRAAGDGHKQEREQLAFDDRPAAVHELRERREPDVRMHQEDAR